MARLTRVMESLELENILSASVISCRFLLAAEGFK